MRLGVPVLLSLVLLSAPALAEEAAKPSGPVQVEVLVLGGGKTPEDGEAWLQRWKAAAPMMEKVIGLAEGFPKVLPSAKVAGLNPGFHIVVLGFCPTTHREAPLALIKAFFPGTYAKPILTHDEGCPEPVDEAKAFATHTVKKDGLRMTAVQVDAKESTGTYVALFRADTLIEHKVESYGTGGEDMGAESCNVQLKGTKGRATSDVSCSVNFMPCNNQLSAYSHRTSYSIDGEKLTSAVSNEESQHSGFCD